MKHILFKLLLSCTLTLPLRQQVMAQDTLYFKLFDYYHSIKAGSTDSFYYTRKAISFEGGFKTWDYNRQQKLVAEGFFDDTLFTWKNGCFIFYNGDEISEQGCFVHDYKDGNWTEYDYEGKEQCKKVYNKGILLSEEFVTEPATDEDDFVKIKIRKEGNFPGGENALKKFITENLEYPPGLKAQKKEAVVVIQFIVRKDGSRTDYKIIKHADPLFEKAALDLMYKMPLWEPAEQSNLKVNAYKRFPVIFCLEDFP